MEMESELRLGGGAGLGALLDPGLWLQLARRALSPIVLLQLAIAIVLGIVAGMVTLALPRWLVWLLPVGFTLWLWPPVLRWFIGAVARRAVTAAATAEGLEPQELPPVPLYRAWWRASMICSLALVPMAQLGLVENLPAILALFAAQVWLATPALVRSVLVPWFPLERIDATLRVDRSRWTVLTAFWFVAFALLHWMLRQAAGITGGDLGIDAVAAWRGSHMAAFVLGRLLVPLLLGVAVSIFCTAAMARMAAQRLLGTPSAPAAEGTPLAFELVRESTRRSLGATRPMTLAVVAALVVALLWPLVRRPILFGLLRVDPDVALQAQRSAMACDGATFKLRMLHWAGVDAAGGQYDTALACAAVKGHLATVKLLVDLGDSPTAKLVDLRFPTSGTHLSAIVQALQSEKGLAAVEYMLAHAADTTILRADADSPDAVQAAAMSHCLACVEWAVRHHAPIDGTWQATPMALWLDGAGRGSHEVADLQHLQVLGLSATAIGEDGRSALHAAANNGDLDAVNWLLAQGADPGKADREGNTPVLYAVARLGTGPDNRPIAQDTPSDRERVQVVQRLIGVSPTLDRGWVNPMRHVTLWPNQPYIGWAVDFDTSTRAYPQLQEQNGASLADLVNPS